MDRHRRPLEPIHAAFDPSCACRASTDSSPKNRRRSSEPRWWERCSGGVRSPSCRRKRPGRIGTNLQSLVRKELIRPDPSEFAGEDAFRFGHILTRDAAYDSIPKQIGELHAQLADWLEQMAGDRISEFEEIVGYHLEQAYRYQTELGAAGLRENALAERAGSVLGEAGFRAAQRGDSSAAENLLRRSVSLLPRADRRRLEIVPDLSLALMDLGQFREAEELLRDVDIDAKERRSPGGVVVGDRPFLVAIPDPPCLLGASGSPGVEAGSSGIRRIGVRAGTRACRVPARVVPSPERARSRVGGSSRAWSGGGRKADLPRDEARSLSLLAEALLVGPTPIEEGLERCASMTAKARGNQLLEAQVLLRAARLHAHLTKFDQARELNDRAGDLGGAGARLRCGPG